MAAPKGNQFWLARSKHGRNPIFQDANILFDACQEYFQWVEDNPLIYSEVVKFQGEATLKDVPKMRAMTLDGLCIFLDIARKTWDNYRSRDDFLQVTAQVESVIRSQKFAGAAADLLNANIIARDLGLRDAKEISGPDGGAIPTKITIIHE